MTIFSTAMGNVPTLLCSIKVSKVAETAKEMGASTFSALSLVINLNHPVKYPQRQAGSALELSDGEAMAEALVKIEPEVFTPSWFAGTNFGTESKVNLSFLVIQSQSFVGQLNTLINVQGSCSRATRTRRR